MNDDVRNSTPSSGDAAGGVRRHLWRVPAGEEVGDAVTVDSTPDSMGGLDFVAMLRTGDGSDPSGREHADGVGDDVGVTEQSSSLGETGLDANTGDDGGLDDFELRYADGSTAPVQTPRRGLFRRGGPSPSQTGRAYRDAGVAAANADVWAAHRDDAPQMHGGPDDFEQPILPAPRSGRGRRRTVGLIALLIVLTLATVGVIVASAGGGAARATRSHAFHDTKNSRRARKASQATTPPPRTHSATAGKTVAKKRRHHKQPPPKREADLTTTATATTPAITQSVSSTRSVMTTSTKASNRSAPSTTAKKRTNSNSAAKTSTGSASEPSGGALPTLQQTNEQP